MDPIRLNGHFGAIVFDGRSVTIEKKLRGASVVPVEQVTSIEFLPAGIGMSGIRFTVSGATGVRQNSALGSHKDIASDPYGLTFRSKYKKDFEELGAKILAARDTPPAAGQPDLGAQIANLAALHEAGALSADEFAAAKARLLG